MCFLFQSRQTDVLTAAIKYIKECQSTEQTLVDSEIDSNCAKYGTPGFVPLFFVGLLFLI